MVPIELRIGDLVGTRLWGENALFMIQKRDDKLIRLRCVWVAHSERSLPTVGFIYHLYIEDILPPNPMVVIALESR